MMTTRFSIACEPGAVVLMLFRFTDGQAAKKRPAVILTGEAYHTSRLDTIMVALTTNLADSYVGDCDLLAWHQAGLPRPTKSKGVIQTIERHMVDKRSGTVNTSDFQRLKDSIRSILEL